MMIILLSSYSHMLNKLLNDDKSLMKTCPKIKPRGTPVGTFYIYVMDLVSLYQHF